jgi:hypothetical protein
LRTSQSNSFSLCFCGRFLSGSYPLGLCLSSSLFCSNTLSLCLSRRLSLRLSLGLLCRYPLSFGLCCCLRLRLCLSGSLSLSLRLLSCLCLSLCFSLSPLCGNALRFSLSSGLCLSLCCSLSLRCGLSCGLLCQSSLLSCPLSGCFRCLRTSFIQFGLLSLGGGFSCCSSFRCNSFSLNSCCQFLSGCNTLSFCLSRCLFCGGTFSSGLSCRNTLGFSGGCGALCLYPLRFCLLSGILRSSGLFCSNALGFRLLCRRLFCGVAFGGCALSLHLLRCLICGIAFSGQLFS